MKSNHDDAWRASFTQMWRLRKDPAIIWRTRSNARLLDDVGLESVPIEVIDGQSLYWSAPAPLLAGAEGSREWQFSFETAEGRADASFSARSLGPLWLQTAPRSRTLH